MPGLWIILVLATWLLLAASVRAILINPRGDVATGLAWHVFRVYARVVHRLRVEGLEHVPRWRPGEPPPGPLVIVANHVSGADPLLIQASCVFEVRWLMLTEMMVPALGPLWRWINPIPVGGTVPGSQSARAAIRYLESGGVVGIFPEGGIERPPGVVLPFEPGVGLIIAKSGAPVLQAIIDGLPESSSAFASLFKPSHARVRFLPVRRFDGQGPKEIAAALEGVLRGKY